MSGYRPRRAARHETLRVRGLDMHLRRWGPAPTAAEPPLVLLHGWQDTGDTFQFLIDAMARDRPVLAPDWRGFGRSEWAGESYWFPDYFADLDALLDQVLPDQPVRLVGHSMGGNVATLFAGLRPERVRCIVTLEGVGLPRTRPADAPAQLRQWLKQVRRIPPLKTYESFEALAAVIGVRFPRFGAERARFVAEAWAETVPGGVRLLGDARHRWLNPVRYQREDAEACWREVRAPVLLLLGTESDMARGLGPDGTIEALERLMADVQVATVGGAGHMLHIEQPGQVAALIEPFLSAH